ncbi:MAG: segregation/condensation protein A [Candidatus Borkfalkiaceae bacterium]|nr:segregation/condensation protein A [Christensenellaceae bacterium]
MAEFESVVDYSTKLENFEGPLDLLLHLIKEAKIEIKDIFVSEVTEQFLEYMNGVSYLDVDKASEYLSMAATLIEIKSKSILPKFEEEDNGEEDPQQAFFRQVEEYKLFKEASEKLKTYENVDRFYKEPDKSVGDVKFVYKDFTLDGLIKVFSQFLMRVDDKKRQENALKEIPKEVFTVKEQVDRIREVLLERKSVSFFEIFSHYYTRTELITTFQAMLELLKLQYITVEQNGVFDDITLNLRDDRNEELGEIDEYT